MSLLDEINKILIKEFNDNRASAIISSRPDLGQFQSNTALLLAKEQGKNPMNIASEIAEKLKSYEIFTNIGVASPGFLNITISDEFLARFIEDGGYAIKQREKKRIVIDSGGANVAKPLHVGHCRPAIIGEGLKRLAKAMGYDVINDVHMGDWGRPIGMVIYEIKRRGLSAPLTMQQFEECYTAANVSAKENPEALTEIREITAELQRGREDYITLWQHIMDVTKTELKRIYGELNVHFDLWLGESDSDKYIPAMMKDLEERGLTYISDGATVMDVTEEGDNPPLPPILLYKSDGASLYSTTDLATILQRVQDYAPDEIWYIVDTRQSMHFKQVFRAAYKSNIAKNTELHFLNFGTMNGKDNKPFKTRDGGVMRLNDLVDTVIAEARAKLSDMPDEEKDELAHKIGLAALKYADSISYRSKDYMFDASKFTEFEGRTGPYILYTVVRIRSILKKARENGFRVGNITPPRNQWERDILLLIAELPEVCDKSFDDKSLNTISDYLFRLASAFSQFYTNCRILTEEDSIRSSWLRLLEIVRDVCVMLLDIMSIEIPDKM